VLLEIISIKIEPNQIKPCNKHIQLMRPLQLIHPTDLTPGKMYLIQETRPEYAYLKYKGTFVKNKYPEDVVGCTMTHFTNVVAHGNRPYTDMHLQDCYWNYYEADAVERAYIDHVLREITGDPSFIMS